LVHGYVPVIASLGIEDVESQNRPASGARVLNVNADVLACRLAAAPAAADLVIAGATPGVLDATGGTIAALDVAGIDAVITSGTGTAGMIAKRSACRTALLEGVASVRIIDGRLLGPATEESDAAGATLHGI